MTQWQQNGGGGGGRKPNRSWTLAAPRVHGRIGTGELTGRSYVSGGG